MTPLPSSCAGDSRRSSRARDNRALTSRVSSGVWSLCNPSYLVSIQAARLGDAWRCQAGA